MAPSILKLGIYWMWSTIFCTSLFTKKWIEWYEQLIQLGMDLKYHSSKMPWQSTWNKWPKLQDFLVTPLDKQGDGDGRFRNTFDYNVVYYNRFGKPLKRNETAPNVPVLVLCEWRLSVKQQYYVFFNTSILVRGPWCDFRHVWHSIIPAPICCRIAIHFSTNVQLNP